MSKTNHWIVNQILFFIIALKQQKNTNRICCPKQNMMKRLIVKAFSHKHMQTCRVWCYTRKTKAQMEVWQH